MRPHEEHPFAPRNPGAHVHVGVPLGREEHPRVATTGQRISGRNGERRREPRSHLPRHRARPIEECDGLDTRLLRDLLEQSTSRRFRGQEPGEEPRVVQQSPRHLLLDFPLGKRRRLERGTERLSQELRLECQSLLDRRALFARLDRRPERERSRDGDRGTNDESGMGGLHHRPSYQRLPRVGARRQRLPPRPPPPRRPAPLPVHPPVPGS